MSYHSAHRSNLGVTLEPRHVPSPGPAARLRPRASPTGLHRKLLRLATLLACALLLMLGLYLLSPLLVRSLAGSLPTNWIHGSSERVLAALDEQILQPSLTDTSLQNELRNRFASLNAPSGGTPPYRLIFRHSQASTPLLLSLPSGDIIVTDRFLATVQPPELQLALLCQQLGHLQHQHALHNAIGHKLLRLAGAAMAGSAEHSIDALTDGLQHTGFSARQLQEADRFALTMLVANHLPPQILQHALNDYAENGSTGKLMQPAAFPSHTESRLQALPIQSD